jgi:hypothetical protein
MNRMTVRINGDFHEFEFSGPAADVIDSTSFEGGEAGLLDYPFEPELAPASYSVVPGHLGQAWIGNLPERFSTLTKAEVILDNDIDLRAREFGSFGPKAISAGVRSVLVNFSLYEKIDEGTRALYQAARQRSPVPVMFQLGQQSGQLFGVYMKSVVPEVPEFQDGDRRLEWQFTNCRAQGTSNDEIYIAFA